MGDASIKLNIKTDRDLAIEIVTSGNLTPLAALSGIHGSIFEEDTFGSDLFLVKGMQGKLKLPPPAFGDLI
jgi:hypothetical protein